MTDSKGRKVPTIEEIEVGKDYTFNQLNCVQNVEYNIYGNGIIGESIIQLHEEDSNEPTNVVLVHTSHTPNDGAWFTCVYKD